MKVYLAVVVNIGGGTEPQNLVEVNAFPLTCNIQAHLSVYLAFNRE